MKSLKKKAFNVIGKVVNKVIASTSQDTSEYANDSYQPAAEMRSLCRQVGAESIVMLKNENNVLPVSEDKTVSVFGRVQNDWFYVGYGSGGDVNAPYKTGFMQGLKDAGININCKLADIYEKWCRENPVDDGFWGHWPMCYDEMPLSRDIARDAARNSDTAIVIIGRAAGEDRENKLEKGSYYLTDEEVMMLDSVTAEFKEVVVLLNCGSIMDMSKLDSYGSRISSILYVWQSGMESGNAVADVLSGRVSPCGKLTDTIARNYEDYPSSKDFGNKDFNCYTEDIYVGYRYFETFEKNRVLYPFGFGMSYTDFEITVEKCAFVNECIYTYVDVKNTGKTTGKEVVQAYFEAPCGKLGKASRSLLAFGKTKLIEPGESDKILFELPIKKMASYDDENNYAYVLEKGLYKVFIGSDVRSAKLCCEYEQAKSEIVERYAQTAAPKESFNRLKADENGRKTFVPVPTAKYDLKKIILESLPEAAKSDGRFYLLKDVKEGRITMQQFVAQLSVDELEAISRGDYIMGSPLGAPGNAGVFGGVLKSLRDKGVPAVTTTDGPSGIRLKQRSSLLPIGTGLACTWNTELVKELYYQVGLEMRDHGSHVLLAPGMNIHRNPLCGRNFEYFSEDPVVTGLIAAAIVEGLQKTGVSACPKHFACNNQETNRTYNDSRVSERALREIYLKGFEICVKKAKPQNIMTSYNKINGVWGHYHYELCERILRKEWGYTGCVMTDWWMRSSKSPEFPNICDQAYRVRAGVNVLMPGGGRLNKKKPDGTLLKTLGDPDGITLGELQKNAADILNFAINSSANR